MRGSPTLTPTEGIALERLLKRNSHLSQGDALKRIESQASARERFEACHVLLSNHATEQDMETQVDYAWAQLEERLHAPSGFLEETWTRHGGDRRVWRHLRDDAARPGAYTEAETCTIHNHNISLINE